ncbi:hypothetical protein BD626DRAFT_579315 [Schizophyllum amplum]|uniref:CxC2-like cysteine cluster KDZ transposase-associated domain-containing protein n=1 Tax=Schizophyllum amplum TaxID=97359 RepID=A0A550BRK0_9AGAR|nr:hypothetical protein BD626DRAFT_579315 [Auriculariopsis ampla]
MHETRPFCVIERWTGDTFQRTSLQELGLRIRLGHPIGERCPCPKTQCDFIVIHTNGMHKCTIEFCACLKSLDAGQDRAQLLRRRLFPATCVGPNTCCTFEVLRLFHMVTLPRQNHRVRLLHGSREVDGHVGDSRLEGALSVILAQRSSMAFSEDLDALRPWFFLYTLFIAMDACFRLKRRNISSREKDPALIDGGAYMVESGPFENFLKSVGTQSEISTCTGLAAIDHANTKFNKGYAETGTMLGLCARHEFVQANGVVPTQVGERYANTDYALASLLRHHDKDLYIILSYDICCQYSKQLACRLAAYQFPPGFRVELDEARIRFVIPKLHIHGHKLLCQLLFNLNWTCGCARTDGEGVERPWAAFGALGTSLRAMGPGSASDTINDHIFFWNGCREISLGRLTRRRLIDGFAELAIQTAELDEFRKGQAEHADRWEAAVIAFESDRSQPNPFEPPNGGTFEADVALELATEDEIRAREGLHCPHEMTPSAFVLALLDIENQHRSRSLHDNCTENGIGASENEAGKGYLKIEGGDLGVIEERLRNGGCGTSLEDLRNRLVAKSRMLTYKNRNMRHQGATTRARGVLKKNDEKVDLAVGKYIDSRAALIRLADGDGRRVRWPALDRGKDVRCMEDPDKTRARGTKRPHTSLEMDGDGRGHLQECRNATGEGRRTVSWIWKWMDVGSGQTDGVYHGMRIEYCKAFSRVRRWREEAAQWDLRAASDERAGDIGEGARAYAKEKASSYRALAASFEELWHGLQGRASLSSSEVDALRQAMDADADASNDDQEGAILDEEEVEQGEELGGDEDEDEGDEENNDEWEDEDEYTTFPLL